MTFDLASVDRERNIRRNAFRMARYSKHQARRLYKLAEEAETIRDAEEG